MECLYRQETSVAGGGTTNQSESRYHDVMGAGSDVFVGDGGEVE